MTDDFARSFPARAAGKGRAPGRTIRLAYRDRAGARWSYSPSVIRTQAGWIEVSLLIPLRIGLAVEIERPEPERPANSPTRRAAGPARATRSIHARVTACRCNTDGLFCIRLTYPGGRIERQTGTHVSRRKNVQFIDSTKAGTR